MSSTTTDDARSLPTPWMIRFFEQHHNDFISTQYCPGQEFIMQILRKANFCKLSLVDGLERPLETWLTDPKFIIDDLFYKRIRPALVLASRFIWNSADFFDNTWNHEIHSEGNKIYSIHDLETSYEQKHNWISKVLGNINEHDGHATLHYGQHTENGTNISHDAYDKVRMCALQLNHQFHKFFTHPSYNKWSTETVQRTLYILATTIPHEIVHLCYRFRWQRELGTGMAAPQEEPLYKKSDPTAELGLAWKRWAFGGTPDIKYDNGYTPYTGAKALGNLDLNQVCCWSGCQPQTIMKVKASDASDIPPFFDPMCWRLWIILRSGKHPDYDEVVGKNFIDTMKAAQQMMEFRAVHGGSLPRVDQIQRVELREEFWDTRTRASANGEKVVTQSPPSHRRQPSTSPSTSTTTASLSSSSSTSSSRPSSRPSSSPTLTAAIPQGAPNFNGAWLDLCADSRNKLTRRSRDTHRL
ncbi:uncharacterized protein A1O9_08470 [Exophiala aquamarina CBS 119918]|uniref:Uncharacterized protein n=1 Tax=Exophiala aquamarina CBS 119918 TaxID=1182545 RepID=A0A072PJN4_9EURO|nr:uncharacterized protein A1O9_08470 [Exophiala aquamarina CBS 119918]KEF55720.1 hypothetical protein A1O9_08470 [Exophiala aquamarina CBS 119918]